MEQRLIQGSPEWLEMRRGKIGASDAPIIKGLSPWRTAYQLWEEKLGLREPQQTNAAMQRGNELEPIALKAYNDCTGHCASPQVVFHPDYTYMMASLDGLSLDGSIAVEIKCPGQKDHDTASMGKVPEKYYPQLQHQLATIGHDMIHYFSYRNGEYYLIEVPRNDPYIKDLYAQEAIFWQHLQDFDPPRLCDRDFKHKDDEQWAAQAAKWSEVNAELQEVKANEKKLRDSLIRLSENRNCFGAGVKLQKILRRGNVDYSAIEELKGVDLDAYRKPVIESWRIYNGIS